MAPLAALAFASTALATPKGILSVFAQCPVKEAGATLCNNAFSAPIATGCRAFGLLDGILDLKIGLPSVLASEKF